MNILEKAEKVLDDFNGTHGNIVIPGALCQWCGAVGYDTQVGIVHLPACIILELREAIKEKP